MGQCVPTGDPEDCEEVMLCAAECADYQACIDPCLAASTPMGQETYTQMVNCVVDGCDDAQPQSAGMQLCALQECAAEWSLCTGGFGGQGCAGILGCLGTCGDSVPCVYECIFSGSQSGQILFWTMQECFVDFCGYCGNDNNCLNTCIMQDCVGPLNACQNG